MTMAHTNIYKLPDNPPRLSMSKVLSVVSVALISVSILSVCPFLDAQPVFHGDVLEVGIGMDHTTINSALEHSRDGDTIIIHEGIYEESIIVEKSVEITAADGASVTIDGIGNDTTVDISGDGVLFNGINVTNSTYGINIEGKSVSVKGCSIYSTEVALISYETDGVSVSDLSIWNTDIGIEIWSSNGSSFKDISIYGPRERGIRLVGSGYITIANTTIEEPGYHPIYISNSESITMENSSLLGGIHGLFIFGSRQISLHDNHISRGIGIQGDEQCMFDSHSFLNNTADSGEILFLVGNSGEHISSIDGQLILVDVRDCILFNCTSRYLEVGIILAYSTGNILLGNDLKSNFVGIYFHESTYNTLHHNNLINNTRQVYSADGTPGANNWTDGLGNGNHWSDYLGTDEKGVGVDMVPHPFKDKGGGYHELDPKPLIYPTYDMRSKIDLTQGWNFISLSLVIPFELLQNALSDISYDTRILFYCADEQTWQSYIKGRSMEYNTVFRVDRSLGFWIHTKHDSTLDLPGIAPASTEILLYPGWNMVGIPSEKPYPGSNMPEEITLSGIFNSSNMYMIEYHPASESDYHMNTGYWLKLEHTESVVWTVSWCET